MELPIKRELAVTADAVKYAKIISAPIENSFQRKRAYASIIALDAFADFLVTQDINVNISKNLFKIAPINEEFEISDLYYNGWKLDVRVVTDNNFVSVPLSHFKYDIVADLYVAIKVDSNLENAELIGFVPKENITKSSVSGNYYLMRAETISSPDELIEVLKTQKISEEISVEHSAFENNYLSYLDKEIDAVGKKSFIKHLINCPECRSDFVEIYDFEAIVKNMASRTEFFEDHTLSIIGAQVVDSEKYAGKEEFIEIDPVELDPEEEDDEFDSIQSLTSDDNDEILGELFGNPTEKMIKEPKRDDGGSGFAAGAVAGAIGAGAVIAGAAAAANAQAPIKIAADVVDAASTVLETGANIIDASLDAISSPIETPAINEESDDLFEDLGFEMPIQNDEDTLLSFDEEISELISEEDLIEDSPEVEDVKTESEELIPSEDEFITLDENNEEIEDLSSLDVELLPTAEERNHVVIEDRVVPILPEDEDIELSGSGCDCETELDDIFVEEAYDEEDEGELIQFEEFDDIDNVVQNDENTIEESITADGDYNFLGDDDSVFNQLKEQEEIETSIFAGKDIEDLQVDSDFLAELSKTLDDTITEFESFEAETSADIFEEQSVEEITSIPAENVDFDEEDDHGFINFGEDSLFADESEDKPVPQDDLFEEEGDLITLTDEDEEFLNSDDVSTEPAQIDEDITEYNSTDTAEFETNFDETIEPAEFVKEEVVMTDPFSDFIDAGNEMKTEEEITSFENPIQLSYETDEFADSREEEDEEEGGLQLIGDLEEESDSEPVTFISQNDNISDRPESDFEEYESSDAEKQNQQDLQFLYQNSNKMEDVDQVDERIEYMVNKPDELSILKDKKVVIAASLILGCLILSSVFGVIAYKDKTKKQAEQAALNSQLQDPLNPMMAVDSGLDPQAMDDGMPIATGNGVDAPAMELAKGPTASVPRDLNKSMTNVFDENPSSVTVTKIAWEVPQYIASSELFKKYLQIAGKNLQINLKNDLMNATEFAYNDSVKVLVVVGKDNAVKKMEILSTSGSQQVDELVLQSIKATLKYINVPQLPDAAGLGDANPQVTKLLKANVYPLTLVINF